MWKSFYWNAHHVRRNISRYWKILDDFSLLPPDTTKDVMQKRLRDTLSYFAARGDSLPEWRAAARITDPAEFWSAWNELPIVTKNDLQNRFHPSELLKRFDIKGIISSTGGSTGEPTPFLHDRAMLESNYATSLYARREFGWKPGMPTIIIWGSERDIGKQRSFYNRTTAILRNEWIVDGYSLNEQTASRVLELIERHRKVTIWGFSSLLEFVARQILERKLNVPPQSVIAAWNGGEMLYDSQREIFREAFGVTIFNMYGGRELSTMAYQKFGADSLRILRPLLYAEIVDDNGKPVAPGETGRLIWTSTVCRATPFLRYDIGDVGSFNAQERDESGIRFLASLQGRHGGLIKLGGGKTIGGLFWNHFFKDYPEVKQFQVVILADNKIELRLVGSEFALGKESQLRQTLGKFLEGIEVSVTWVERLKLTAQGKLLQVIREESVD